MQPPRIDPKTNGKLRIFVKAGAVVVSDASVVVDVISPSGHYAAQNITCAYSSTYGAYVLPIDPAWSTGTSGEAIEGGYLINATVNRFGDVRKKVLPLLITFKGDT